MCDRVLVLVLGFSTVDFFLLKLKLVFKLLPTLRMQSTVLLVLPQSNLFFIISLISNTTDVGLILINSFLLDRWGRKESFVCLLLIDEDSRMVGSNDDDLSGFEGDSWLGIMEESFGNLDLSFFETARVDSMAGFFLFLDWDGVTIIKIINACSTAISNGTRVN